MAEKEDKKVELETLRITRDIEATKLGFKDFTEFSEAKAKLDARIEALSKREDTVQTREDMVGKREIEVEKQARRNDAVKANLINRELEEYKKASSVRAYAFQTYFGNLDSLFAKLYNAKSGRNCMGLVKRGRKNIDELVVIDTDFQEELVNLIKPILMVLRKSPKFNDEGEYLTAEESEEPLDEEQEAVEELVGNDT